MRTVGGLVAAALLALATLGGCGDDDGGEEERVAGAGYSYAVPEGWEDASDEAEDVPELEIAGVRPDTLVIGEREEGFASNVNVIREAGLPPGVTASDYAEVTLAGLRDPVAAGFPPELVEAVEEMRPTNVTDASDAELGGEEASAWDFTSHQNGRTQRIHQVATVIDETGYTVTLTVLPQQEEDGREAFDEVLDSWRWQ